MSIREWRVSARFPRLWPLSGSTRSGRVHARGAARRDPARGDGRCDQDPRRHPARDEIALDHFAVKGELIVQLVAVRPRPGPMCDATKDAHSGLRRTAAPRESRRRRARGAAGQGGASSPRLARRPCQDPAIDEGSARAPQRAPAPASPAFALSSISPGATSSTHANTTHTCPNGSRTLDERAP